MEKLKPFIHPELYNLIEAIRDQGNTVEDIVFDADIKTVIKKGEMTYAFENGVTKHEGYGSIPQTLAILNIGKEGTRLGILYTLKNKKPFKLMHISNLSGTRFIISNTVEDKNLEADGIYDIAIETISKLPDDKPMIDGLTTLVNVGGTLRTTAEILGSLQYGKEVKSTIIKKVISSLPLEAKNNPVVTILRINTHLYNSNLSDYLKYSPVLFAEIGELSMIFRRESETTGHAFNVALSRIANKDRHSLVAYAMSQPDAEIAKVHKLLADVKTFNQKQ